MNLNKVLIIGRLTNDPQLRSTKTGQAVAVFSVATNRQWTDQQNQKREEVEYHNIVVWGKQAETTSKYLLKGQIVYVEGRLQTRSYEDKAGVKKYATEIVAERVQFGPKAGGATGAPGYKNQAASTGAQNEPVGGMNQNSGIEEIPTINIDEEIKAEDLPF
jgi:single-strand DNA-binding protein